MASIFPILLISANGSLWKTLSRIQVAKGLVKCCFQASSTGGERGLWDEAQRSLGALLENETGKWS